MANLSEGTYIILNVKSKMAIDVKGASDSSGTNVQQYTKNNSDAQIWALTEQSNGWQIICSLTGKSLDVNQAASGQNVRQWNDNNTINQRWVITEDNQTITYNGKTYSTYVVKAGGNNSFVLDIVNGSTSAGANLQLYTANGSDAQRWIFIPVSSLKTEGVYEIVLADDTSMCIDIAGGSTANKANAQVYSRNGSNAQKFFADVDDDETFTTVFRNVGSNRVLDINGGVAKNGANIQQYTSNNTSAQKWLPLQNGTVKIDGQTTPTYNIRAQTGTNFVMDCKGGGKTAKTNIQLYTNNNSIAQRFAFVKTDVLDSNIATPASLSPRSFTRSGPGSVTIEGLTFSGTDIYYQARYRIRYFTAARATHTDTSWMNVKDDSTSRSGWGDAWNYSVEVTENANGDLVFPFAKTVTLNNTDHRSADIYIEYRAFRPAGTGSSSVSGQAYPTHGEVRQVVISVTQTPIVTVSSFNFVEKPDGSKLGIRIATSDTFGSGCEIFRGRILGEDGSPITEWVAANSMTLSFYADEALRRFPDDGEVCALEYQYLSNELSSVSGTTTATFSYGSDSLTLEPSLDNSIDAGDSCSVLVTNQFASKLYCFVEVPDTDGTIVHACSRVSSVSDRALWECLPPLNKDVNLIIMGSSDGNNWSRSELVCRVNSHNFIWNWAEKNSFDYYENYAIVIINTDAPPSQTRNFTNDIQFNSPMGRVYPVGFASTAVSSDFSVEGVMVDPNASYQSAEPLPDKATKEDILKLVRLSGKGIHPIYRTPYGDWQIVAIEGVEVSKSELNLSTVSVRQRVVDE